MVELENKNEMENVDIVIAYPIKKHSSRPLAFYGKPLFLQIFNYSSQIRVVKGFSALIQVSYVE
jgi:hypothetical protein